MWRPPRARPAPLPNARETSGGKVSAAKRCGSAIIKSTSTRVIRASLDPLKPSQTLAFRAVQPQKLAGNPQKARHPAAPGTTIAARLSLLGYHGGVPSGKPLLSRFAGVAGVVLVTLAVAEVGLRLVQWVRPSFIFASGDYNRFRGRPHAPNYQDRLNSLGFNDREREIRKPPGTYRIVAVGDSFVFGIVPREHTFVALLERHLAAAWPQPVEVINLGIPSTGPQEYVHMLRREGLAYAPDLVLCFVFLGNDFFGLDEAPWWRRSYLAEFATYVIRIVPAYRGRIIHGPAEYDDEAATFERGAYLAIEKARAAAFDTLFQPFSGQAERVLAALDRMHHLAATAGAGFAVVLIPDELQIDPDLRREVLALPPARNPAEFDWDRPNRLLADTLGARGVPVLDLTGPFRSAAGEQRLYRRNDSHWNLAGNALAARRLGEWLQQQIPSRTARR